MRRFFMRQPWRTFGRRLLLSTAAIVMRVDASRRFILGMDCRLVALLIALDGFPRRWVVCIFGGNFTVMLGLFQFLSNLLARLAFGVGRIFSGGA